MGLYLFIQFRYVLSSDDAVRSVLAKIAGGKHELLAKDWVYANGDIFLATPYAINLVLTYVISDAFTANAASSFAGYLILLGCFYLFCSNIEWKHRSIPLISTIFLASGISLLNLEFVVAQGIYSTYSGFALLAVSTFFLKNPTKRKSTFFGIVCLVLTFVLAISNPKRALGQFFLPLLLAWIFTILLRERAPFKTMIRRLVFSREIVYLAIGFTLGTAAYYFIIFPKIMNFDAAINISRVSISEAMERIFSLPMAWVDYLKPRLGTDLYAGGGEIINYIGAFIAFGLFAGPAISAFSHRHFSQIKLLAISFGFLQCGISAVAMVTNKNLFIGFGEIRYLSIGIMCFIPFFFEVAFAYAKRFKILPVATGLFSIYVVILSASWVWPGRTVEMQQKAKFHDRLAVVHTLKDEGVCTVFTTYWDAYVSSVAGNFQVLFYPVEIPGLVQFQAHHSYRGPALAACARSALLLSNAELTPALRQVIGVQFGSAASELVIGDSRALIFDNDIYSTLLKNQIQQNTALSSASISVEISRKIFNRCNIKSGCPEEVTVTNLGQTALVSQGSFPIRLGIQGLDSSGRVVANDVGRISFPIPLAIREKRVMPFDLPYSGEKVNNYQLCVVQDGIAWHCDRTITGNPI
jgi:hypothetical protein